MNIEKEDSKVIMQNFMAIKESQESISRVLKIELKKLKILEEKLELDNEINVTILKEINKTINSLIMYEWINNKKIETINEFYNSIK